MTASSSEPSPVEVEVDVDGFPVRGERRGAAGGGTPLVLLHAFSLTSTSWHRVVDDLAADRIVVTFDRLGFGRSSVPPRPDWRGRPNPFTTPATVQSVFAVVEGALSGRPPILVGSSAGGTLALLAALTAPERLAGLVLVDAPVRQGPPPLIGPAFALAPVRAVAPTVLRAASRLAPAGFRDAWSHPGWADALVELTLAIEPLDLTPRLSEVRVPTLVVAGSSDRIVSLAAARTMADALPDADLTVIEGAGHLPHESRPAAFLQAVRPFLRRVDAGR